MTKEEAKMFEDMKKTISELKLANSAFQTEIRAVVENQMFMLSEAIEGF